MLDVCLICSERYLLNLLQIQLRKAGAELGIDVCVREDGPVSPETVCGQLDGGEAGNASDIIFSDIDLSACSNELTAFPVRRVIGIGRAVLPDGEWVPSPPSSSFVHRALAEQPLIHLSESHQSMGRRLYESVQELEKALVEKIDADDFEGVARDAHSMKGIGLSFGVPQLEQVGSGLQQFSVSAGQGTRAVSTQKTYGCGMSKRNELLLSLGGVISMLRRLA